MTTIERAQATLRMDADYRMVVDAELLDAKSRFDVLNPASKRVIASVPSASRQDLDRAVEAASRAFPAWAATAPEERQAVVSQMADMLAERAEDFMALLTREQGKPRAGAEWEVQGSVIWLRAIADQCLPEEVLLDDAQRRVVTRRTPLGVVGAITPWNFPILLAVWKIAPALVTGNAVVLKPSPFTPLCTLKFAELWRELIPAGVLNVVSGGDELGGWITSHPAIAKIAFTGSTETGRAVMRSASETIKRITLELGGNDPAIVMPDVDPHQVAGKLFWAAFQNNAQFCNATKRLYVHDSIYEQVRDQLVAYAQTVVTGDGADSATGLGPIQNEPQFNKVKEFFDDCREHGHRFAIGGEIDESAPGWFVPVTIVDDPPEAARIVQEEPFGPILPILRWTDEDDVVARANDTQWGLGASVWGRDLDAVERVARRLDAGTVWINEVHQYAPNQPFGGHKQSGLGCENGIDGLAEYANWQTITLAKA
jgi:acyl-CoA reductase-like NAD-dependent aldehyde dehydrogenase